ncbi:hypothetical protein KR018_009277, partial [Drosophila ironensis]
MDVGRGITACCIGWTANAEDHRNKAAIEGTTRETSSRQFPDDDHIVLPPSYDMAYKRLVNVEKKMKRNGQFAQAYSRIIKDYVLKGYA